MSALILRNKSHYNTTVIKNEFIDYYMAKANGEYVKIYLLLLRHLNTPDNPISISKIADCLENTEKDVLRALNYWEKAGLLKIEHDEAMNVVGLEFTDISQHRTTSLQAAPAAPEVPAAPETSGIAAKQVTAPAPIPTIRQLKNQKELKQLLFVAEQYLGKTLSRSDIDFITYFQDELNFSTDLIEYLIEYCVENNHKSMHYIKTVALSWAEQGIKTVFEAKERSASYNKNCYTVLKAFGITGRGPALSELEYIKRWTNEYGFTLDILVEACSRTIANTHQPSFEYADSILKSWKSKHVHYLSDIEQLDNAHKKELPKKASTAKTVVKNKFNNFEGRSYDMDALESKLLQS